MKFSGDIDVSRHRSQRRGFTLVEIIVSMAVAMLLMAIIHAQFSQFFRVLGTVVIDGDIREHTARIAKLINCEKTLQSIGVSGSGGGPPPTEQVQLLDKKGHAILKNHSMGGIYAPYRMISADWLASARWTGKSIAVSLAKKGVNNLSWAKDPASGIILDFNLPKMQIYGDPPDGIPLCSHTASSRVLEVLKVTNATAVNPLIGLAPTSQVYPILWRPLAGNKACHLYCKTQSYTAGRMLGLTDGYGVYDAAGNFVKLEFFNPGESIVHCGCFL